METLIKKWKGEKMLDTIMILFTIIAIFFMILSNRTKNLKKKFLYIIPALGMSYIYTLCDVLKGTNFIFDLIGFSFFAIIGFKRLIDTYTTHNLL